MVVPMEKLIQKFKVGEKMYSVDWPVGLKYFYGVEEVAGALEEKEQLH